MDKKVKGIRGNAGRPELILQWLKDQGAKNSIGWFSPDSDSIYYVDPDGSIEKVDEKHECLFDITKTLRWRANFDEKYWFINNVFKTQSDFDSYCGDDSARYERGNYFQSKNEAEEYLSQIINLLKERK